MIRTSRYRHVVGPACRRLFAALSAFSLLLFVAVCVIWVLNYGGTYSLLRKQPTSSRGGIAVGGGSSCPARPASVAPGAGLWAHDARAGVPPAGPGRRDAERVGRRMRAIHGVAYGGGTLAGTGAALRVISVPHWLVALATAALPAA